MSWVGGPDLLSRIRRLARRCCRGGARRRLQSKDGELHRQKIEEAKQLRAVHRVPSPQLRALCGKYGFVADLRKSSDATFWQWRCDLGQSTQRSMRLPAFATPQGPWAVYPGWRCVEVSCFSCDNFQRLLTQDVQDVSAPTAWFDSQN